MMKYALAALALLLAAAAAQADPLALTMAQCNEVLTGLSALDGADHIAKDGEHERVVRVPYKFSGGFLLAVAKNEHILRELVKPAQEAIAKKRAEIAAGKDIKPGSPEDAAFAAEADLIGKQACAPDLVRLTSSQLSLDVNQIPPSVLSLLAPILDDK